jgi:Fe-S-cluster containining protein
VPISEIEARQLSELVAAMPEERRNEIHRRFAAARKKLREGNLLKKLEEPDHFTDQVLEKLPAEYFQQAIPCPFLENESCSIHADRPLACREYLVTSPADYCAQPDASKVQHVRLPAKMSSAVMRLSRQSESRLIPYVPLILALEWVTRNPDEMAPRKGTEILTSLVESLFGQEVKANGSNDSPTDSDAGANDGQ